MAKFSITVKSTEKIDMDDALDDTKQEILKEAIALGIKRARLYAPVDTGALKSSIEQMAPDEFGSSIEYAGYVEGSQPYLEPAAADVARAIEGIANDALKRSM